MEDTGLFLSFFGQKTTEFTTTNTIATTRDAHWVESAILILLHSILPLKIELHVGICRIRDRWRRTDPDFDAADFRANEKIHLEHGSACLHLLLRIPMQPILTHVIFFHLDRL